MKTYRSNETGLFVARQADQVEGETYETVEVPTNPKEEHIKFLNQLQAEQPLPLAVSDSPAPRMSDRPQPTEEEQCYAQFRADVAEGRVLLDEYLLAAPLDVCLRLAGLVYERTREHYAKEKRNDKHD